MASVDAAMQLGLSVGSWFVVGMSHVKSGCCFRHAGSFVVASRGRGLRAAGNSYGSDQGVDALPRSENEKQLRVAFFLRYCFFVVITARFWNVRLFEDVGRQQRRACCWRGES